MIALMGVRCTVADDAELMKEVGGLVGHDPLELESAEEVGLGFFRRGQETGFRGGHLGQEFAELTQLDQAGIRIVLEVAFSQSAEAHELGVVYREEIKIGGYSLHLRPEIAKT